MSDHDVIVVGLGALGGAAAWRLARRGLSVLGLERFDLGHVRGASHGDSRIIRQSYHRPGYVRSAAIAYDGWALLAADSGRSVVTVCGGVDVFPPGTGTDVRDYTGSLDAADVGYRVLDAEGAAARWPGLAVPAGSVVLQQERTGIVAADRALADLHAQARARGAELLTGQRVTGVHEDGTGVTVTTQRGERFRAGQVIVATDGWTNQVLDVDLPLSTTQEYVTHFAVEPGSHLPGDFPVWIWMDEPSFYGFPSFGEASVKVGEDAGGRPVDPDRPAGPSGSDQDYLTRLGAFARRAVPGAGRVLRTTRCLYTVTPDRDFVVGPAPGHERVQVALGAAHGFKFAPWFGLALADLAQYGGTDLEIDDFAADRAALR